jgi:hypothetical protein
MSWTFCLDDLHFRGAGALNCMTQMPKTVEEAKPEEIASLAPNNGEIIPPKRDEASGQFKPGNKYGRGRKGARNRLHADFISAAQEHFEEIGKTAFEIVFRESPKDYLKILSGILPKEFILEDGRLESMSDEEISDYLAEIRCLKIETGGN